MNKLAALCIALAFAACHKKETTVVETHPEARAPFKGEAVEPAPTGSEPAAAKPADAAKTDDTALLVGLSPDDKTKYEAWFKKYNLTPDPSVLDQDADADGYSNREEFLANTNPRDPNSLPGVIEGVSVKAMTEIKIPIILRDVKPGKAHIERTDGLGEEDLREGSQPKGLAYRVTGIKQEVKADKHGVFTDVSNVTLVNPQTKEKVILVLDMPARSSETHAVVVGADGIEQKIYVDEIVTLPGQGSRKFKVLELRSDQVVVEELGTKRPLTIPKR
jgi:hypothetical protein